MKINKSTKRLTKILVSTGMVLLSITFMLVAIRVFMTIGIAWEQGLI